MPPRHPYLYVYSAKSTSDVKIEYAKKLPQGFSYIPTRNKIATLRASVPSFFANMFESKREFVYS